MFNTDFVGHMDPEDSDSGKGKGRDDGRVSRDPVDSMGRTQKFLPAPGQEATIADYEVEEVDEPEFAHVRR
jgi:hypothetical protein